MDRNDPYVHRLVQKERSRLGSSGGSYEDVGVPLPEGEEDEMSVLGLIARQTKILILDEHQGSRTLLRRELQSAHYDVVTAVNKEECLILARTIIPDLVLVSARMSEIERLEILEQLKVKEKTSGIPIIVLAGKNEFEKRS